MAKRMAKDNGKSLGSQQSVDSAIWSVCDILRRSNCAGALQYVPELTWMLFLRILDEREQREADEAKAVRSEFTASLKSPYRWRDWAAPWQRDAVDASQAKSQATSGSRRGTLATSPPSRGWKRAELTGGAMGAFFDFVNRDLLPHLKGLKGKSSANDRQKVISEIMVGVERTRIDTEKNMLDVLDKLDAISEQAIDPTHVFPLSQVYEGLLLKMGEKGNDGGQFFTPREIIRAIVKAVDPKVGKTVYDPCCGTGGFLAQAYDSMLAGLGKNATARHIDTLKRRTFFGREKENLIYPIALSNLILHGVDRPNLWHGNTLTGQEQYGGLFQDAPGSFDFILTNPPFGGKEGKEAQTNFAYKTSATQILFLQHVIDSLADGGTCGMVVDEGVLFRTNEKAFVGTKRKLLDDCDLWCIVSLPPGVFTAAGAGVKTNLLFFTKGKPTKKIWYYDLADVKVGKKKPFVMSHMDEFFKLLPKRGTSGGDSERSWTVERKAIEAKGFDLKAVNPNRKEEVDTRTPVELLDLIDAKGREVRDAIAALRATL